MDKVIIRHILRHRYLYLLFLLAAIAYWRWLFTFNIFATGDWGFQFHETAASYLKLSIWDNLVGFGGADAWSWRLPLNLLYGLFSLVNLDKNIAEKFIVFWPTIITGIVASYLLIKRFFGEVPAFFGALVFNFNTYYLASSTHFLLYTSESFGVAAIYCYIKALEKLDKRYFLLSAIFLIITAVCDIRGLYLVMFVMAGYAIYVHLFVPGQTLRAFFKIIGFNILFLTAILAMLAYWLLGTYTSGSLLENDVLSRNLFGDSFWSLQASTALFHPFWAGMNTEWFVAHPVAFYFWIVPLAALAGLYFRRHDRRVLFFAALALLGIFLAKQSDEPFASTYLWLYNNVPGFNAFREATKFYFFVILGYSVLIAALVHHLMTIKPFKQRIQKTILGAIALVFVINLVPLARGTLNAMYVPKKIPNDYALLNKYIQEHGEGYRTLWVPRSSKWGLYTSSTPKVEASEILGKQPYVHLFSPQSPSENALESLLRDPHQAIFYTNIRYVIVPSHDDKNSDDIFTSYEDGRQFYVETLDSLSFLKPLDLGTRELKIYENSLAQPYTQVLVNGFSVKEGSYANSKNTQFVSRSNTLYAQASDASLEKQLGLGSIDTLFDAQTSRQLIAQKELRDTISTNASYLQVNQKSLPLSYIVAGKQLTLIREEKGGLYANGHLIDIRTDSTVKNMEIDRTNASKKYYASIGSAITQLNIQDGAYKLGDTAAAVKLHESDSQNILINPSFEDGLWQKKVDDCNPYSEKSNLNMYLGHNTSPDESYLVLYSRGHTACTFHEPVPVTSGSSYLFSFDYKSSLTRYVGYKITFNDTKRTVIEKKMETNGKNWQTVMQEISVPSGASKAVITLKGYPGTTYGTAGYSYFDRFRMEPLRTLADIPALETKQKQTPLPNGTTTIAYRLPEKSFSNAITNPSFENGSWQKAVGDCNNYDNRPDIAMKVIDDAFDGQKALRLEAARHTACINQENIAVQGNATYLFSFEHKASNTKQVRYRLAFNDSAQTVIDKTVAVRGGEWENTTLSVKTPLGATGMGITLYAAPDEFGKKRSIIHYDDFSFIEIPTIENTYQVITPGYRTGKPPASVITTNATATKKTITIQSATEPFYLKINEAFDKKWTIINASVQKSHIKTANNMNAWLIDPEAFCAAATQPACTKNNDGSYTMTVVTSYAAQKYFYVGLAISFICFISIMGYLLYDRKKR